jgi:hypothetical protein
MQLKLETNLKNITEITVNNPPQGVFITLDIDWAHDEVIEDSILLLEKYNAKSTLFITHKFSCLEYLQNNPNYEIGIHPNFKKNIEQKKEAHIAEKIVDDLLTLVPEAKSIRSHRLINSSYLTSMLHAKGLTHESNIKIPLANSKKLFPYMHPSGMMMCPFHWGDYSDIANKIDLKKYISGYLVLNFHPIHIYLNSINIDSYESTRSIHKIPKELLKYRSRGIGVRNQLIEILELVAKNNG